MRWATRCSNPCIITAGLGRRYTIQVNQARCRPFRRHGTPMVVSGRNGSSPTPRLGPNFIMSMTSPPRCTMCSASIRPTLSTALSRIRWTASPWHIALMTPALRARRRWNIRHLRQPRRLSRRLVRLRLWATRAVESYRRQHRRMESGRGSVGTLRPDRGLLPGQ